MLGGRNRQQGVALLLFLSVLVIGVAWFAVGALGKAAPSAAEREMRTGLALQAAKQALLGYVALKAADAGEESPGRLPCPESLSQPGIPNDEGIAAPFPGYPTCSPIGRLPWKTLGTHQLRDGHGEPLWYAVATGTWALVNSSTSLTINPGTANPLPYDGAGSAVVAVIIAPGAALNTLSDPGTPPAPCARVNQLPDRYAVPYAVAKFLECGNSAGTDYTTIGTAPWSNDRTISITASEVMDAIAAAVADRLQRQVAPALNEWRTTASVANWNSSFLPYASTFTAPAANDLCGDFGALEGQLPVSPSPACDTRWTNGTVTQLAGLLGGSPSCAQVGGNYRCTFTNLSGLLLLKVRISADAPRIGTSLRNAITAGQIANDRGGTVSNLSFSVSSATGTGSVAFELSLPLLAALSTVNVTFPNVPDAAILSDSRMAWFVNNNWAAYTHYAIAPGVKLGAALPRCTNPGDADCLTLNGLPASNGNSNDKRLVLTLMGRAVGSQSQPSIDPANYLESHTAGSLIFTAQRVSSTFNDRNAACPFQQTPASGGPIPVCD
jgi:hypothetical protein